MVNPQKVAVLGAGSWATALAVLLGKKGHEVRLWARRPEVAEELNGPRTNEQYLPGVAIPPEVTGYADLAAALKDVEAVVLGVPSHAFRGLLEQIKELVTPEMTFVNTAKGIEEKSLLRLSQVFAEVFPGWEDKFVVLSGPSHAEEVGRGVPTTVVSASSSRLRAEYVQDLFMTTYFRVYTNPDVIGVELGGALKNIIALGTGISDGLGFGDNTKAALMTRGLVEISRLGIAMGAKPLTFAGLAGVGDLIVTCTSMHSRNRRAGIELGKGKTLEEALASVKMVVEGVRTTRGAFALAQKYNVEMPIVTQAYQVLFEGYQAKEAVSILMTRLRTHEMEEVASELKW